MPAKTQAQQAAFGAATAIKKGKMKPKKGTPSAKIASSMSLPDIEEFASTPVKGLPKKARKSAPKKTRTPTGMPTAAGKAPPAPKGRRPWL